MKFTKLTKKLLLSALSLGLAVVTLTTTTFAWYTSSTEANATGSGMASGTTDDSTLMISSNNKDWSQSAEFEDLDALLKPVAWNGTKFVDVEGKDAASTDVFQFTLYFKTTKSVAAENPAAVKVYLNKILIANADKTLIKEYDNLTDGKQANCPTSTTYSVDMVRALDMLIDNDDYELSNKFTYATDKESGFGEGNANIGTADALAYYNAVMGSNNQKTRPTEPLTNTVTLAGADGSIADANFVEIGAMTATGGAAEYEVLPVTFTVFLNGWDAYCFDACRGQKFTLSLGFTTEKNS